MLSHCSKKNNEEKPVQKENAQKHCRLVRGQKPLIKHRFYLNVKNHVVNSKIESKIKELGGIVELFLTRDVTHVVTDSHNPTPPGGRDSAGSNSTPQTSNTPFNASTPDGLPDLFATTQKRPKSRADAMLQRVRLQPMQDSHDPLNNARRWGIPIWPIEKIFKWLDKIAATLTSTQSIDNKDNVKIHEIKPPYIKFEPYSRNSRPVCQRLFEWPRINFNPKAGESVFICANKAVEITVASSNTMQKTRASRLSLRGGCKGSTETEKSGYCEICRTEYMDLNKHVRSDTHLAYVQNDANYTSLDKLISSNSIDSFISVNGKRSPRYALRQHNSIKESDEKMDVDVKYNGDCGRRTRSSVDRLSAISTPAPAEQAGSGPHHHLRSRGQLWLPTNLLGTTAEDEGNPVKPSPPRDSRSNSESTKHATIEDDDDSEDEIPLKLINSRLRNSSNANTKINNEDSCQTPTSKKEIQNNKCRKTVKAGKRTSADKRLTENTGYYKVEMCSKLRSSGSSGGGHKDVEDDMGKKTETSSAITAPCNGSKPEKRLVVKFKRVRRSELSVLSDEAENFMFPRRDESSEESEEDDEGNNSATNNINVKQEPIDLEHELQDCDVSQDGSYGGDSVDGDGRQKRKKRRTHAEVFIMDNQKYYKFETPGSRLRFQGSFMPHLPASSTATKDEKEDDEEKTDIKERILLPPLTEKIYSFEVRSKSEPYRDLGSRCNKEVFECYRSESGFVRPYPLPYERREKIQPLDPQICIDYWKQKLEQLERNDEAIDSSENAQSEQDQQDYVDLPSTSKSDTTVFTTYSRRRKRGTRLVNASSEKHPRKSPRQHASTLAILSGLLHQRKRRDQRKVPDSAITPTLTPIPEESNKEEPIKPNPVEDATRIMEDFNKIVQEESDIDFDPSIISPDAIGLETKYQDVADVIMSYSECQTMETVTPVNNPVSITETPRPGSGLFRRKKRKKNKTGWPKKKQIQRSGVKRLDDNQSEDLNVSNLADDVVKTVDRACRSNSRTKSDSEAVLDDEFGDDTHSSNSVNVDLEKWENAEKVLSARIAETVDDDRQSILGDRRRASFEFQPIVRVQKIDENAIMNNNNNRRLRSSSSPSIQPKSKRQKKSTQQQKRSRKLRRVSRSYRDR